MKPVYLAVALGIAAPIVARSAAANDQDLKCRDVLVHLQELREPLKACYVARARPLVAASQERPETIATAVDAACQPEKDAVARRLLVCMSYDQATDAVERFAKLMRGIIIQAIVEYRAGLLPSR